MALLPHPISIHFHPFHPHPISIHLHLFHPHPSIHSHTTLPHPSILYPSISIPLSPIFPSSSLHHHTSTSIPPSSRIPIPPSTSLHYPSLQLHPFIPTPVSFPHPYPHPFSHAIPGSQLTLAALWVAMAEAIGAMSAAVTAGTSHILLAAALPRNHAQRHVRVPIAGTSIQRACRVTVACCQERGS